jgi:hypothetical protein
MKKYEPKAERIPMSTRSGQVHKRDVDYDRKEEKKEVEKELEESE